MKNIITEISTSQMAGSVFYGNASVKLHDKTVKFTVCNHLKVGQEMEFRAIGKARAGWNTIFDFTCKPEHLWQHISKHTQCVQVKVKCKGLPDQWFNVYITKNQLWETVDIAMLETCTVGDIHSSAPKMRCYETWKRTNAKSWACKAFVKNA